MQWDERATRDEGTHKGFASSIRGTGSINYTHLARSGRETAKLVLTVQAMPAPGAQEKRSEEDAGCLLSAEVPRKCSALINSSVASTETWQLSLPYLVSAVVPLYQCVKIGMAHTRSSPLSYITSHLTQAQRDTQLC